MTLVSWRELSASPISLYTRETSIANNDTIDALERFREETLRVYSVLEDRLAGRFTGATRDWLAGYGNGKYSATDIGAWPWVRSHRFCGIIEEEMSRYPNLQKWVIKIGERGAIQRALGDAYDNEAHPEPSGLHTIPIVRHRNHKSQHLDSSP
jgi:glutathione S-transferase